MAYGAARVPTPIAYRGLQAASGLFGGIMLGQTGASTLNGTATGLSEPGTLPGELSLLRPNFVCAQYLDWAAGPPASRLWNCGAILFPIPAFARDAVGSV